MDGLSELVLFFRIYMPTMKTTYAAAAIITFNHQKSKPFL